MKVHILQIDEVWNYPDETPIYTIVGVYADKDLAKKEIRRQNTEDGVGVQAFRIETHEIQGASE